MASGEQRHARMVRLFRGDFGENVYSNVKLLGPAAGGKVELLSYFALYPNGDIPYTQVVLQAPNKYDAARHLLGLSFPEEAIRAEGGPRAIVMGSSLAEVDNMLWEIGTQQVKRHELPVIFAAWMRLLGSKSVKVTLWYPSATNGNWALARIKRAVRMS